MKNYKIAVAGTGYVGLSLAVLLSQKNEVTAVDIVPEKVEKLNKRISPIQDKEIEEYLATKDLNLRATTDGVNAYKDAEAVRRQDRHADRLHRLYMLNGLISYLLAVHLDIIIAERLGIPHIFNICSYANSEFHRISSAAF